MMPELIRRKRDGQVLLPEEIHGLMRDYVTGVVPDYQMSALLMAILFRGLNGDELTAWTNAMLHSGQILDISHVPGIKVDKHSTGGVGDKISLCLAPAVAALGVPVPMIAGRGLGHTGGTLDKLAAIPGFQTDQSSATAKGLLAQHGLFLIGQTDDLAPADRALYALRDVTGTVESIPLIASSIMSKKLAEGIDALVLDIKVGAGAFMPDLDTARQLATALVGIGQGAGKQVRALLTNMDTPIGYAVGNALEVSEAIDVMKGQGPEDTTALTVELGALMLMLGGAADEEDKARSMIANVLANGQALRKFADIVDAQGGDSLVCGDVTRLPSAPEQTVVSAQADGYVRQIDPRQVAMAALAVGAGRRVKEDTIDPASGVVMQVRVGDGVQKGSPLAYLHHRGKGRDAALAHLADAFHISSTPPNAAPLIIERM
ncbi:MAG: thymidine phosphorylase [Myxococcota bacterium]|nr:thymidine phosphorylase [Myxococcota bacterium]